MPGAMKPAMRHYLMVGAATSAKLSARRLPGWLDLVTAADGTVLAWWQQHRNELLGEAETAGFQPFGLLLEQGADVDDVMPADEARDRWAQAFCARWGY